jgi:hypothetical protein
MFFAGETDHELHILGGFFLGDFEGFAGGDDTDESVLGIEDGEA